MRKSLALTLLLFVSAQLSSAASLDRVIDKAIRRTMAAYAIPGLSIAVVQDDRVIFERAYGVRELGKSDPVTVNTLFELGSTSKAFTTAAMAALVDEGKMKWDDPVRNYLPYFRLSDPCADSSVTLRDIVSHRTGLSRHDELWEATDWSRGDLIRAAGFLTLSKPIRSAYQYNNIMFVAAGEAVAGAANMPWGEFLQARIFEPLGMSRSATSLAQWSAVEHATGHEWNSKSRQATVRKMIDYAQIAPAGTVKSTAHDMGRWLRFQLSDGSIDGRRIVGAAALAETKKPQTIIPLQGTTKDVYPETNIMTYALGWNVQDYRGELLVAHAGVLNGFRSNVALLPARKVGLAIMENVGRGYALFSLRNTILDEVLKNHSRDWIAYYLEFERKSDASDEKKKIDLAAIQPKTTPADFTLYVGTYNHPAYGDATISLDSGSLVLHWQQLKTPLLAQGPDSFHATEDEVDVDEDVLFERTAAGITSMTIFDQKFTRK
ncbi:MAG TPA: serine hydrolase [Thermoanaerobaculia bacterium]|nr:serine hydrolase [Thermoanaerobaculia bacterium]